MRSQTLLLAFSVAFMAILVVVWLLWPRDESRPPETAAQPPTAIGDEDSAHIAPSSEHKSPADRLDTTDGQAGSVAGNGYLTDTSGRASKNVETVQELVSSVRTHDLALLAAIDGAAEDRGAASEAAWRLFRLRDQGMLPAVLERYTTRYLAHPPRLHAAARDWLEAELGPRSPSQREPVKGRGPRITRFRKVTGEP